jgi:hypothetical protein
MKTVQQHCGTGILKRCDSVPTIFQDIVVYYKCVFPTRIVLGDSYQEGTSEIPQQGLSSVKFEKKVSQMRIGI